MVFVSQTKLWTQIYDLLLELDTCLTLEAQNWTDLNCRLQLSFWDGSDPKIEGSNRQDEGDCYRGRV